MSAIHTILLILVSIAFGKVTLALNWDWPAAMIFAVALAIAYGILFRKPKTPA